MKSSILLLALSAAALSSCTTAYKTGQTPDDVYYSPTRPQEEYVRTENNDEDRRQSNDYYDDRYLRMKVHNRTRWSDLDDWYYYSDRYTYTSYNCCCNSNPWTPYTYWNNYYNPYYHNTVIVNPKNITYTRPRTFNLNAYNTTALNNNNYTNPKTNSGYNSNNGTYNGARNTSNSTSNKRNNSGNFLRDLFKGSESSSSSSNSSGNSSSSSSGSSSSSSSSSSKSTNAPARRF